MDVAASLLRGHVVGAPEHGTSDGQVLQTGQEAARLEGDRHPGRIEELADGDRPGGIAQEARPVGALLPDAADDRVRVDAGGVRYRGVLGLERLGEAGGHLRVEVRGGGEGTARRADLRDAGGELHQAEVGDLRRPVVHDQDVRRLQVTMEHPAAVGVVHGTRQGPHRLRRPLRRLGPPLDDLLQAPPPGVFQRQERVARDDPEVADLDDVGMIEARHCLRLDTEAGQLLEAHVPAADEDDLQRQDFTRLAPARPVDDPHPPAAELGLDVVSADLGQCLTHDFASLLRGLADDLAANSGPIQARVRGMISDRPGGAARGIASISSWASRRALISSPWFVTSDMGARQCGQRPGVAE